MADNKKKLKPGQQKLMDRLKKSQKEGADARARAKAEKRSGGTLTSRTKDVRTSRGPYPVPAVRKESVPAVKKEPGRAVVKYEPPKTDVVEYKPKKDSGTNMLRSFAGGAARAGLRGAGPVGALVGMTGPAGEGSDKPPKYGMTLKEKAEKDRGSPTKSWEKAYQTVGTKSRLDDPVTSVRRAIPIPKAKPAQEKPAGKSATRIAFEKEFAKNRKAGRKTFKFRGKDYSTKTA